MSDTLTEWYFIMYSSYVPNSRASTLHVWGQSNSRQIKCNKTENFHLYDSVCFICQQRWYRSWLIFSFVSSAHFCVMYVCTLIQKGYSSQTGEWHLALFFVEKKKSGIFYGWSKDHKCCNKDIFLLNWKLKNC